MKKKSIIATLFFIVCLNSNVFSQEALKEGVYSLSGSITFSNSTNESNNFETKSLSFFFAPELSYFFIDNLSTGLSFSYGYSELTFQNSTYISRPFSIGPIIRYYFASGKLIPFLEASYRYSNSFNGNEDRNSFSFAGGLNYFLSNSVALEPYIEYTKTNYLVEDQKISNISIGIRVNYFIID